MNEIIRAALESAKSATAIESDSGYRQMLMWVDNLLEKMAALSNEEFVSVVREINRTRPEFTHLIRWEKGLRLEMDCRLLLMANERKS